MKRIIFCDFDGTITVEETFVAIMVAKAEIIKSYGVDESIAIGDSITDWKMAMAASIVFARPLLTAYLDEQQKPYIRWNNFIDIRDALIKSLT